MAFQSCALETVKESVVLELSSVGKFPVDWEMVKNLVGKMTGDCEASDMDLVELSLLMEFVVIAVEIADCLNDYHRIRLNHKNVCALTVTSLY